LLAGPGHGGELHHAGMAPDSPAAPVAQPAPGPSPVPEPFPAAVARQGEASADGGCAPSAGGASARDEQLVEAARQILADASADGSRLSQAVLAERLRGQGWTIANDRLSWLASAIGLSPRRA
jgi:hypothetical protein